MTTQIKQDINALVEQPRQPRTLPPVEPVGGIPAGRGIAPYRAGGGGGGGGGIASPLTETDSAEREYYTGSSRLSVDFLVGVELKPLKTIKMTDADGQPVELRFAEMQRWQ